MKNILRQIIPLQHNVFVRHQVFSIQYYFVLLH